MGKEKEKKMIDKNIIENLAFYTDTLRLIEFYLNCLSNEPPATALASFFKKYKEENNEDSIIYSNIQGKDNCLEQKESINTEKIVFFLEELRILILQTMSRVNKNSVKILQRYHIFLHLFELSIQDSKSKYKKVYEFLESNFKIDYNCTIKNACRGNYGRVIELQPSLGAAIEELHRVDKNNKNEVSDWKRKFGVSEVMTKICIGKFKDFDNPYEEYCYYLFHEIPCNFSDSLLDILDKKFNIIDSEPPGWLRLIYNLTVGNGNLRDCEKSFEKLFFQIFEKDFLIGLDFLSFSRKCEFYFPYLLDSIPLNCMSIENLIRFVTKNKIKKEMLVDRYCEYLKNAGDYERLCRFILNHGTVNFKYSKEFMTFFIENLDRFRSFIKKEVKDDEAINFIFRMNSLNTLCIEYIHYLLSSKYFEWFAHDIVISISNRNDLPDSIILEAMNAVFELQKSAEIPLDYLKSKLAQKLIK